MSEYITVGEFADRLGTEREGLHGEAPLERRAAAGTILRFLKNVLHEPEEESWEEAKKLKDLYDCRTCVNQVAQVYCKGIMEAKRTDTGEMIFGMRDYLTYEEAGEIVLRTRDKNRRVPQKADTRTEKVKVLTKEQALTLMENLRAEGQTVFLLDVRPGHAYEEHHLPGAVSLPMAAVIKNPALGGQDMNCFVFAYCEQGCQSQVAAECLQGAGYSRVYAFAWRG